jgi:hypothetical protein
MMDNVKDIFKQNPSKNMIQGVEWEEVKDEQQPAPPSNANPANDNIGTLEDFALNFSTIAKPEDVELHDLGDEEIQEQNQALCQESNDLINQIGMKMLVTKEYSVIVEKDPLELGDERFDEEVNPTFDKSNMGDHRQWNNWVIDTFDPKQGIDMSTIAVNKEVNVGSYGNHLNPYLNPNTYDISKSISFIAQSTKYEQLLMQYKRNGGQFTDPKFPPNYSSIAGFGDLHGYPEHYLRDITWKRPNDVFGGKFY